MEYEPPRSWQQRKRGRDAATVGLASGLIKQTDAGQLGRAARPGTRRRLCQFGAYGSRRPALSRAHSGVAAAVVLSAPRWRRGQLPQPASNRRWPTPPAHIRPLSPLTRRSRPFPPPTPTRQLSIALAAVAVGALFLRLLFPSARPVYLLDFAMALPPPEWKFPKQTFLKASSCNPVRASCCCRWSGPT